jgi:hypothetical protein
MECMSVLVKDIGDDELSGESAERMRRRNE